MQSIKYYEDLEIKTKHNIDFLKNMISDYENQISTLRCNLNNIIIQKILAQYHELYNDSFDRKYIYEKCIYCNVNISNFSLESIEKHVKSSKHEIGKLEHYLLTKDLKVYDELITHEINEIISIIKEKGNITIDEISNIERDVIENYKEQLSDITKKKRLDHYKNLALKLRREQKNGGDNIEIKNIKLNYVEII